MLRYLDICVPSHWKWGSHECLLMGTMPRGGAHLWKCLLCLLHFCCLKRIRCVSIWGYKCNARPRLCASVSSCQLFLAIKEETKLRQLSFDSNLILLFPPSNVSQVQREEAQRYFTDPADSPRPRLHWWVLCHMFVTHFSLEHTCTCRQMHQRA